MICVTVARHSRRLTLAGIVNAARMSAGLVEVRLDTIEHQPDLSEIIATKRTPLLLSCRRAEDGGSWKGSEEDRLALLRQAASAGADYIAIEHDLAGQIEANGAAKRVICYSHTDETPANIESICDDCRRHEPDVVQITCRARTAEEAWPLLRVLSRPPAPLVIVGWGWAGIMPALLGRKYGSPWTYAAIERGGEAYPGQPTVRELIDVFRYHEIDRDTTWIGVTGLGRWEMLAVALLNSTFAAQGSSKRCLPVPVGDVDRFRRFADRLKLRGVVVGQENRDTLLPMADELDENVRFASWSPEGDELDSPVDVLTPADEQRWRGACVFPKAALAALRTTLARQSKSLHGAVVLFSGLTAATIALARGVKKRGAAVVFSDRDHEAARQFSVWFGGRHVRPEGVYSMLHDVLIVGASPSIDPDSELDTPALHPGFLKPGMTVMDLTSLPRPSPFMLEAAERGCTIVEPRKVLFEYVRRLAFRLRGEEASHRALKEALGSLLEDVLISESDVHAPLPQH